MLVVTFRLAIWFAWHGPYASFRLCSAAAATAAASAAAAASGAGADAAASATAIAAETLAWAAAGAAGPHTGRKLPVSVAALSDCSWQCVGSARRTTASVYRTCRFYIPVLRMSQLLNKNQFSWQEVLWDSHWWVCACRARQQVSKTS